MLYYCDISEKSDLEAIFNLIFHRKSLENSLLKRITLSMMRPSNEKL